MPPRCSGYRQPARRNAEAFERAVEEITSATERLRIQQDLALVDTLETLTAQVEAELGRLSMTPPWAEQVPYLVQLSGLGVLAAMTVLAAIGDIARFPTPKDLVGYAGLGAGVHESGQTHQTGRITKQGRRELRGGMVDLNGNVRYVSTEDFFSSGKLTLTNGAYLASGFRVS